MSHPDGSIVEYGNRKNETLPRVHRRQLLSVSLCFGFLFVTPPPTHLPPHPPPTYPPPHPPTPPTHPPLRFTREQTQVEYIRRCRLISLTSLHLYRSLVLCLDYYILTTQLSYCIATFHKDPADLWHDYDGISHFALGSNFQPGF